MLRTSTLTLRREPTPLDLLEIEKAKAAFGTSDAMVKILDAAKVEIERLRAVGKK